MSTFPIRLSSCCLSPLLRPNCLSAKHLFHRLLFPFSYGHFHHCCCNHLFCSLLYLINADWVTPIFIQLLVPFDFDWFFVRSFEYFEDYLFLFSSKCNSSNEVYVTSRFYPHFLITHFLISTVCGYRNEKRWQHIQRKWNLAFILQMLWMYAQWTDYFRNKIKHKIKEYKRKKEYW